MLSFLFCLIIFLVIKYKNGINCFWMDCFLNLVIQTHGTPALKQHIRGGDDTFSWGFPGQTDKVLKSWKRYRASSISLRTAPATPVRDHGGGWSLSKLLQSKGVVHPEHFTSSLQGHTHTFPPKGQFRVTNQPNLFFWTVGRNRSAWR